MDAPACFRYTVKADVPEWRNGRRGGLKNRCLTTCEFDSRLGHQFFASKPPLSGFFHAPLYTDRLPSWDTVRPLSTANRPMKTCNATAIPFGYKSPSENPHDLKPERTSPSRAIVQFVSLFCLVWLTCHLFRGILPFVLDEANF